MFIKRKRGNTEFVKKKETKNVFADTHFNFLPQGKSRSCDELLKGLWIYTHVPCLSFLVRRISTELQYVNINGWTCLCVLLNRHQPDALPLSATPSGFIFFLCGCFFFYWGGKGREKVTEGKAVTCFNYSSITSSVVNTQQSRKLCILKCAVSCPDLTT